MANDRTREIRRAALAELKSFDQLIDLVDSASLFPQTTPAMPTYPFTRFGAPSIIPVRAAGVDGGDTIFATHGFSKGTEDEGSMTETAEDHAARIGSAMAKALDGKVLDLDEGGTVKIKWTGSQLLLDPEEAGVYHTVQNFRARTLS